MIIFVDAHFLDGRKHGAANFLERLYSQYMDMAPHHEIYFGVESGAPTNYDLFQRPGVHVLRYRVGGAMRFLIDIPILARRIKPDIIHTQYVIPLRLGYSAKRHVTLFDVLYEDFPDLFNITYRWVRTLVFGSSARRADMLSTCSEYSKERILALYRPHAEIIHVIHGGVMEALKEEIGLIKAHPGEFLLYVSRFEKRKNHLSLLKAFTILLGEFPKLKLVLVGFDVDGSLAECDRYIDEHGIRANIQVLSNISDAHITNLFRTAKVVVYPSLCEGFGMPIIESMLLNSKTIFSNTTAMSDFSFAPKNTFDPTNFDAMVGMIRSLLSDNTSDSAEWQQQRRFIAEKYNWKRSAEILLGIHEPAHTKPVVG